MTYSPHSTIARTNVSLIPTRFTVKQNCTMNLFGLSSMFVFTIPLHSRRTVCTKPHSPSGGVLRPSKSATTVRTQTSIHSETQNNTADGVKNTEGKEKEATNPKEGDAGMEAGKTEGVKIPARTNAELDKELKNAEDLMKKLGMWMVGKSAAVVKEIKGTRGVEQNANLAAVYLVRARNNLKKGNKVAAAADILDALKKAAKVRADIIGVLGNTETDQMKEKVKNGGAKLQENLEKVLEELDKETYKKWEKEKKNENAKNEKPKMSSWWSCCC